MTDATQERTAEGRPTGPFIDLLGIKELGENLFQGRCHAGAPMRAFGGQVAAQALTAAGRTLGADRLVHSLHSYFLRPGNPQHPIAYHVDRVRDGSSYSTRRVTAIQRDEVIFTLSASFKRPEPFPAERQPVMPQVPGPEELSDPFPAWEQADPEDHAQADGFRTLDIRFIPPDAPGLPPGLPGMPQQFVWLRSGTRLPDDPLLQVCALTYLSDLTLASTAALHLEKHRIQRTEPSRIVLASLDHAMWFHRPFRADEWLLFAQRSPSAGDGRGLAHGEFYDRAGRLVASAVQETLLREHRPSGEFRP